MAGYLTKMKEAIRDFLYWSLAKIEGQKVERIKVGQEINFRLSRIIPKNGKWYNIALTAEAWIKLEKGDKKEMLIDNLAIYQNGKKQRSNLVAMYRLDEYNPHKNEKTKRRK